MMPGATNPRRPVEAPVIMRALEPAVVDAVWAAAEPLLPPPRPDAHPLGCHRSRASDRAVFEVILVRLVTGCSWVDAERLCGRRVSDTRVRARRDHWIAAGVFDALFVQLRDRDDVRKRLALGSALADICPDGRLRDIGLVLVDEAPPDPPGGVALLGGNSLVGDYHGEARNSGSPLRWRWARRR